HLVAVHHVQDAVREPRLLEELGAEDRGRGVLLRGLQDEGVPAGDGDRVHPHRHHGREVERGDPGADAQGLADRVAVHVGGDVLRELALEELGNAAGELDDLEPPAHGAGGVGEHLAVLAGDEGRDLLLVAVHQVAEREQDLGPRGQRGLAPARGRLGGRGHPRVDHRAGAVTWSCASAWRRAASTRPWASRCPRCASIMAPAQTAPTGLAIPFPAMSGAVPWMGSNIEGWRRSGLMLAPGATPRLPQIAAPRSVRMSPKRFEPTITSRLSGWVTMRAARASTWYLRTVTCG